MYKVVKFGGSSLASSCQFRKVKKILDADSTRCFVVPSAPGKRFDGDTKVTDLFYEYYELEQAGRNSTAVCEKIQDRYNEIIKGLGLSLDLTEEFMLIREHFHQGWGKEYAASRGEYLNGLILSAYLGFPFVDAAEVICFDEEGRLLSEKTNEALKERLLPLKRAVLPGFYGADPTGKIRTFSRGGSDITGSLAARAVSAVLYENWTDVSGFLLADPRIVTDPAPIRLITYRELHRLARMGACVLHEDAVFPVKKAGIPIQIKNTNRPEDEGTRIVRSTCQKPRCKITGIAGKKGFCAMMVCKPAEEDEAAFAEKVLRVLRAEKIPCESTPFHAGTLLLLVRQEALRPKEQKVISELYHSAHADSVFLESDLALVAVGGRGRKALHCIAADACSSLEALSIHAKPLPHGANDTMLLLGVPEREFEAAVRAVYSKFIQKSPKKDASAPEVL